MELELVAPPRCAGCDGACFWYRAPATERLTVSCAADFPLGSAVTLTLPDRYLVLAASLLYGMPLGALLGGSVVGQAFFGSDLGAVMGAGVGLAAALILLPGLRRKLERTTARHLAIRPSTSSARD